MKEPNTTQEEEHLDDLFLEEIDPYAMSKWDKVEGDKEREEVIRALRKRIAQDTITLYIRQETTKLHAPTMG